MASVAEKMRSRLRARTLSPGTFSIVSFARCRALSRTTGSDVPPPARARSSRRRSNEICELSSRGG